MELPLQTTQSMSKFKGILLVSTGALLISTAPIFVKFVPDMNPTTIGLYRALFSLPFLLALWLLAPRPKLSGRAWVFIALAGLSFAFDLFVWHRAIFSVGAGAATVLANTQIFYLSLLALIFLKEKLSLLYIVASVLAFSGVALMANFHLGDLISADYKLGIFLGLLGGFFYSIFTFSLRKIQAAGPWYRSGQVLGLVCILTAAALGLVSYFDQALRLPIGNEWAYLLGLAIIPQVIGWALISYGLKSLPLAQSGILLLLQPVFSVILGIILFQEVLNQWQLIGVLLTITGCGLAQIKGKMKSGRPSNYAPVEGLPKSNRA
ncbi:MAG: hypothetical protein COV44_03335 [Deltaproteobacteria bacterium CG11_big_fil_rev_8_21_14_0_20_45_16]|nr:MAG: hypothetical protein COV44_03335 [Deltaproteobacteria bacterium CG11_big_fil_rev_8_21_14_0_20_45_16]